MSFTGKRAHQLRANKGEEKHLMNTLRKDFARAKRNLFLSLFEKLFSNKYLPSGDDKNSSEQHSTTCMKKIFKLSYSEKSCLFLLFLLTVGFQTAFGQLPINHLRLDSSFNGRSIDDSDRSYNVAAQTDGKSSAANPQPAIVTTGETSSRIVVFPDPENAPTTQLLVTGLPSNAVPHGASYYSTDYALVSDIGNSRIFVVKVSTAQLLDTIDTEATGYTGNGTLAVSPNQTVALALGDTGALNVIRAPFTGSSAITAISLPGNIAQYQTQAIVFNNAGRAFVYHTTGISVLDAPYTSVAFTIPYSNSDSGAVAISPDGNTLLVTRYEISNDVGIFNAPFSAESGYSTLYIDRATFLDGIKITPDGTKAIVVTNNFSSAFAISAPFTESSLVENLPLPISHDFGAGDAGLEDVAISPDGQSAILSGGSDFDPPVLIKAPFTAAGAVSTYLPIQGIGNPNRGAGVARFRPVFVPTAATVSVGGRILTEKGLHVSGATISLVDSTGIVRIAISDFSGYYRFEVVETGTAVLTARAKRYSFSQASQVLNVTDEMENINFIASSTKKRL